jgi:hypothetical protein
MLCDLPHTTALPLVCIFIPKTGGTYVSSGAGVIRSCTMDLHHLLICALCSHAIAAAEKTTDCLATRLSPAHALKSCDIS